jgi:acyl-CoA thioesterase-1
MDRRLVLLALLALSACGGGGSDPAPTPAAPPPPPPAPLSGTIFVGDSITVGMMRTNTDPTYTSAAIEGQTSAEMLARFQADVLSKRPATVVILAGTNDILRTPNPDTQNVARMAEMSAQLGARVVIGLLPPNENWEPPSIINDPVAGRAEIQRFNQSLRALAGSFGYRVADYYAALTLPDGSQNAALFADGTHPNLAGIAAEWTVVKPHL